MDIELVVRGITERNKREKVLKAAHALSERIGVNASIDAPFCLEKAKTHKYISKKWENGQWVYEYPKNNTTRRINHANQVDLMSKIKPLDVTCENVYQAISSYDQIFKEAVNKGLKCKWIQNRKVEGFVTRHLTKKQGNIRSISDVIERAKLLPFVLPIIQKYGHVSHVERNKNGGYDYELVGKAKINKKKYAITVIMSDSQNNPDNLVCISLFGFTKNAIKSLLLMGGSIGYSADPIFTTDHNPIHSRGCLDRQTGYCFTSSEEGTLSPNHDFIIGDLPDFIKIEKAKTQQVYPDLELLIQDITLKNRKIKFARAIRTVATHLGVPVSVQKSEHHGAEPYEYLCQQDLSDYWSNYYDRLITQVYKTVSHALDLPTLSLQKAQGDPLLVWRGKLIYSPETGQPLKQKDFDRLITLIEKYLAKHTKGMGKKLILDAVALGKLLNRMVKEQGTPALARQHLTDIQYKGRDFDWIRKEYWKLESVLGHKLERREKGSYQVASDYAAQKVVRINETVRSEIKETLLYGIKERRSKGQVALDLFNKLGHINRDWKRIADTELNNTTNLAGIKEELHYTEEGEKVYFKRIELPGCCPKCKEMNGKIALWTEEALGKEKVEDDFAEVALWEGKGADKGLPLGTVHPNCRGHWIRCFKPRLRKAVGGGKQFDESEHKRDEKGRFTNGSNTGNETEETDGNSTGTETEKTDSNTSNETEKTDENSTSNKTEEKGQFTNMDTNTEDNGKEAIEILFPEEVWVQKIDGVFVGNNVYVAQSRLPKVEQKIEIAKFQKELVQAQILGKDGHSVYLLPESKRDGNKKIDALMDGIFIEFKTVTGGYYALNKRFSESRKQSKNVFIKIDSDLPIKKVKNSLIREIQERIKKEPEHKERYQGGIVMLYFTVSDEIVCWEVDQLCQEEK